MASRAVQQGTSRQRSMPPQWTPRMRREVEVEAEEPDNDQGVTMGRARGAGSIGEDKPVTKSGFPDRRFKGQRDLPPPEMAHPDYRRARTGGVVDDIHVTLEGRPDRRFKENRAMSEEEVLEAQIQTLQAQRASRRH